MSDDEERDRRGRFERTRSPQQRRRSRSPPAPARSRSPGVERRGDDPGRAERPGPDDPPATLFVAELPPNLQGYMSSRLRTDRGGQSVAFIEFNTGTNADRAIAQLQGHKFDPSHKGINVALSKNPGGAKDGGRPSKRSRDADAARGPPGVAAMAAMGMPATMGMGGAPGGMGGQMAGMGMGMGLGMGMGMGMGGMGGQLAGNSMGMGLVHPFLQAAQRLQQIPPKVTLYVEGVPNDATEREVYHLFRPFPGFISLRLRGAGNRMLCFVEFEQQEQATLAMATLDGYVFDHAEGPTGTRLKVAFAKSHGGGAAGAGSGGGGADRRSPRERDPRDDRGGGGGGGGGRRRSRSPMRR